MMKLLKVYNKYFLRFKISWINVFIVTIFSYPVPTNADYAYKELSSEDPDCTKNFSSTGSYTLEIKDECSLYSLNLDSEKSTSIINLSASITHVEDTSEINDDESFSEASTTIKIYEASTYSSNKENFLMEEWTEKGDRNSIQKNYLSRSSKILVTVSGGGNLSQYKISFIFREIEYSIIPILPSTTDTLDESVETAWVTYHPNSVFLLSLYETKTSRKGIEFSFCNLTIDTEMGEYLLIGTGTEPLQDTGSQSLFVTQISQNTTFYVDNPSAYVAFVSGSTKKDDEGFNITWKIINEVIEDVTEDPLGRFNSSLICFYNATEANEEFQKEKSLRFQEFRESFAKTAQNFTKNLQEEYKNIELHKESIDLFGNPTEINSTVISVLLKVVHQGKSIFTWRMLQTIIEDFEQRQTCSKDKLKCTVGKCPHNKDMELPFKDDWNYFIYYAMVPIFAVFALMMWAWKQNVFAENCMPEKEEKVSFGQVPAEPNPYVTRTVPKVCRYDEQGRRETLIPGSPQQEKRSVTEETAMVEMDVIPSTSKRTDTLTRFLTRSKSRPSIQSLIDQTGENNKMTNHSKAEGNESDHLYDSVGSSKELSETKL